MKINNIKKWFNQVENLVALIVVLSTVGLLFMIYATYSYYAMKLPVFENFVNELPGTTILISKEDAFCENHLGSSETLENSCNRLTENNCGKTSCCVWTDKCVAGDMNGPTFNIDENQQRIAKEYQFQNKIYHI
jgi:hypothetical protein